MIAAALHAAGRPRPQPRRLEHELGVATALLEQRGSEGLFEVDEAWLPRMVDELDPELVVLANLFRDQLDRYGELSGSPTTGRRWSSAAPAAAVSCSMPIDPLVADLGRDRELRRCQGIVYFGIEDPGAGAARAPVHAHDAKHCRSLRVAACTSAPSSATSAITSA